MKYSDSDSYKGMITWCDGGRNISWMGKVEKFEQFKKFKKIESA